MNQITAEPLGIDVAAAATTALNPSTIAILLAEFAAYAGVMRGQNGKPDYHLSLLAGTISDASWEESANFAQSLGGSLPTADEMVLLAKLHDEVLPGPYWTAERIDGQRAMAYSLHTGIASYSHTSNAFMARAVRRTAVGGTQPHSHQAAAVTGTADALNDAELWPVDGELLAEIHAMFLTHWGMHADQADARMSRFNYQAARAALEGGAA